MYVCMLYTHALSTRVHACAHAWQYIFSIESLWKLLAYHFYILLSFIGAVAVLTCAAEFNPQMAQVVKARPSDDFELSEV